MDKNLNKMLRINRKEALECKPQYEGYHCCFFKVIGGFCPRCGVEWYGSWETDIYDDQRQTNPVFSNTAQQEIKIVKELDQCPLCGVSINRETRIEEEVEVLDFLQIKI